MPEIDREILDRAMRWCAESGRPVREDVVRAVLEPLGWDELLAVKAILADPPPGRDLSPADLARPFPRRAPPSASAGRAPEARRDPGAARRRLAPPGRRPGPRIRRARDRVEPPRPRPRVAALPTSTCSTASPGAPSSTGWSGAWARTGSPSSRDLAAGWSAGGGAPTSADLDRLLEHHGLARGFAERERALLLHAFRKHGGVVIRVARELGIAPADLRGALDAARASAGRSRRSGRPAARVARTQGAPSPSGPACSTRRRTPSPTSASSPRFEADLRRAAPRAPPRPGRWAAEGPSAADLGRSLSLSRGAVDRLVARFGLQLRAAPPERPERRERRRTAGRPAGGPGGARRGRTPGAARRGSRSAAPRAVAPSALKTGASRLL